MTRAIRTVVAAALCVAMLAGAAAGTHAQAPGALPPARYAALDAVYVASLPLDGQPTPAQEAELRRVCEALDRSDRLLAALGGSCLRSLEAIAPARAYARCETRRGCLRTARRLRIALSRSIADARAANEVVAQEVPAGACRTELRSSKALLGSLEALRDGLRLLERGLRENRRTIIRRAESRIARAGAALDDQATAAQSLEIFRGVCAPAP